MSRLTSIAHLAFSPVPLFVAYRSLRHAASCGVDGEVWEDWTGRENAECAVLSRELLSGAYVSRPLREVRVLKPDGSFRPIRVPCLRDKVVQRAMSALLWRVWRPSFDAHGVDLVHCGAGSVRVPEGLRRAAFVARLDVRGCFDAVPWKQLLRVLRRRVADARVLDVIGGWCAAGLPQGLPCSPVLASIYLQRALDGWLYSLRAEGRCVAPSRFVDDVAVGFRRRCDGERFVEAAKARVVLYGLEIRGDKSGVFSAASGVPFLGLVASTHGVFPASHLSAEDYDRDGAFAARSHYRAAGVSRASLRGLRQ